MYVTKHTYDIKKCIAFAKKSPVLSADNAIFIDIPPHLVLGHNQLTIKINQPNNIIILLALIFYYLFLCLSIIFPSSSTNGAFFTSHHNQLHDMIVAIVITIIHLLIFISKHYFPVIRRCYSSFAGLFISI